MNKILSVVVILLLSIVVSLADKPVDTSYLPASVQRTIKEWKGDGEVKKIKTRRVDGRTAYEVEYKERGDDKMVLIAEDGSVLDEDPGKGKGKAKGKGKGKAKGHYKDDRDRDEPEERSASTPQVPAPVPAPTPSRTETPVPTPSTAPAPAQSAPKAPASASTSTLPRSAAEVRTELGQRINRINKLDNNPDLAKTGLTLISKETGVPLSTLQAQRKGYPVGTGGMLVCNEIAKTTHKNASVYLKQRLQNRDWTQIAAETKFDLATVLPKLDRIEQGMLAARKKTK